MGWAFRPCASIFCTTPSTCSGAASIFITISMRSVPLGPPSGRRSARRAARPATVSVAAGYDTRALPRSLARFPARAAARWRVRRRGFPPRFSAGGPDPMKSRDLGVLLFGLAGLYSLLLAFLGLAQLLMQVSASAAVVGGQLRIQATFVSGVVSVLLHLAFGAFLLGGRRAIALWLLGEQEADVPPGGGRRPRFHGGRKAP